jgi:predicted RNA polymerase sigma factor
MRHKPPCLRHGFSRAVSAPRKRCYRSAEGWSEVQRTKRLNYCRSVAQNATRFPQKSCQEIDLTTHSLSVTLDRAQKLGRGAGFYALQAGIAACHARARTAGETDWPRILLLYDALSQIAPSPIISLNRAVALAMAEGPARGLEALDQLRAEPSLVAYHLLPSVRGDLLLKLGRFDEARKELERAAAMTRNTAERNLLLRKIERITAPISSAAADI